MTWHPSESFQGFQETFDLEVMTIHNALCDQSFLPWKDTDVWFRCSRGHVYWRKDEHVGCAPYMEGTRNG